MFFRKIDVWVLFLFMVSFQFGTKSVSFFFSFRAFALIRTSRVK